jgi:hypothetical protein
MLVVRALRGPITAINALSKTFLSGHALCPLPLCPYSHNPQQSTNLPHLGIRTAFDTAVHVRTPFPFVPCALLQVPFSTLPHAVTARRVFIGSTTRALFVLLPPQSTPLQNLPDAVIPRLDECALPKYSVLHLQETFRIQKYTMCPFIHCFRHFVEDLLDAVISKSVERLPPCRTLSRPSVCPFPSAIHTCCETFLKRYFVMTTCHAL